MFKISGTIRLVSPAGHDYAWRPSDATGICVLSRCGPAALCCHRVWRSEAHLGPTRLTLTDVSIRSRYKPRYRMAAICRYHQSAQGNISNHRYFQSEALSADFSLDMKESPLRAGISALRRLSTVVCFILLCNTIAPLDSYLERQIRI